MTKKEKHALYSRRWYAAHKNYAREWRAKNAEEYREYQRQWYAKNKKKRLAQKKRWRIKHKEKLRQDHIKHAIKYSLKSHHRVIFNEGCPGHRTYVGMPFESRWNPKEGGSFSTGEKELLLIIGPKPNKESSLHVVDHEKGVVLGNLVWATKQTQSREQMCKIIANLRHENILLRQQLVERNQ